MTTAHEMLLGLILPAYLLGSVPFGLLVARTRGVDPRKAGSGNIGASNVARLLGRRFFFIVFALDLLKGLVPMLAAAAVLGELRQAPRIHQPLDYVMWLLIGLAAILGHMFSVYIGFKGGKGVATSAGVVLGLFPYYTAAGIIAIAVWIICLKLTRYISISSIVAAIGFVLAYMGLSLAMRWPVFSNQWPLLLFAVLVCAMIVYKHRDNLARLRAGTEHRLGTGLK